MKNFTTGLFLLTLAAAPVTAADLDAALGRGEQRVEASRQGQQRIDTVSEEIRGRVAEYRAVEKQIEGLNVYIEQLKRQLGSQQAELAGLEESVANVTLIERQITPLMLKMIDALNQHVALDVPFLPAERAARVERLHGLIGRSDVTVAEKFRHVFDAYQTEMEYGRTIEAYRDMLAVAGEAREVDVLRVGRIGLYYITLDGSALGAWNREAGQWEALPGNFRRPIVEGLRIAREQAAPDLINLPLPAPEEATS